MSTVYARFGTLLGAVVEMVPTADPHYFRWRCLGCFESSHIIGQAESATRDAANTHASTCRALPRAEDDPTS